MKMKEGYMSMWFPSKSIFGSNHQEDFIDISNTYEVKIADNTYFVKRNNMEEQVQLTDIFGENVVHCCNVSTFICSLSSIDTCFSSKSLKEAYPELEQYPERKVPKQVLERLYAEANEKNAKELKKIR